MFKYVGAIANKEENLWVKWVHSVYLKQEDWWSYEASPQGSWYWKQVVAAKNQIQSLMDAQQFTQGKYQISLGYQLLCPSNSRVNWSNEVWGRFNTPKHSFIMWIAIEQRLRTRDRLHKFGVIDDSSCLLCHGQEESNAHLFFGCPFSKACLVEIKNWMLWHTTTDSATKLVRWIAPSKVSKFRKKVMAAALASLIYHVWKSRNNKVWNDKCDDVENVVNRVKETTKVRIIVVWPKKVSKIDTTWFHTL
ncbi:uncharacterized protein LOC115704429 [Cannabis sativa]|uniref:uncharacterized protein LOC115704429 n=1 Tax=Cannabis sativa TaxID=3483 RepID=UPI0029CA441E|nr:uncharacterized protein LOC115704429 [Cannabis sativa]